MLARRHTRPALGAMLCVATLLSAACFGGQQATQATPTSAPTVTVAPTPPRLASPSPFASPSPSPMTARANGPEQTHTVEVGDTLATIAQKFYEDPTLWRKIFDANKAAIGDNPDAIKVGTELKIPPKD